ncbi:hypothetical protein MG293_011673 [Ovis ammon polii]|uniref:Uncharacterized protein n=1 Tax=Ovis ammon polii TaxID=230172 RepID=A0AAD4Y5B2_OVIAM|nr:hypothetical protein MG293_011673 [Ovis ammon polii]
MTTVTGTDRSTERCSQDPSETKGHKERCDVGVSLSSLTAIPELMGSGTKNLSQDSPAPLMPETSMLLHQVAEFPGLRQNQPEETQDTSGLVRVTSPSGVNLGEPERQTSSARPSGASQTQKP